MYIPQDILWLTEKGDCSSTIKEYTNLCMHMRLPNVINKHRYLADSIPEKALPSVNTFKPTYHTFKLNCLFNTTLNYTVKNISK